MNGVTSVFGVSAAKVVAAESKQDQGMWRDQPSEEERIVPENQKKNEIVQKTLVQVLNLYYQNKAIKMY